MSERYVKVNDVETVESSNSTALVVLVVSLIAIVVIGMIFWQPWAAAQPQGGTTIIHERQTTAPDNRPIIVNPPANSAAPGNTKIDIRNDVPPAANKDAGSSNNATNDDAKNAANN